MSSRLRSLPIALVLAALLAGGPVPTAGVAAPPSAQHPSAARGAGERKRPNGETAAVGTFSPTLGERAARSALRAVGVRYRWGGESPTSGFDCSGLVRWAYGRVGVELPHSSYRLSEVGRSVPLEGMAPGDVLLFAGLGHVGLYLGDGRMVHAPQTGRRVEVVRLARSGYGSRVVGARRVVSA